MGNNFTIEQWRNWLETHCEACGEEFCTKDYKGGRCLSCGKSMAQVNDESIPTLIARATKEGFNPSHETD